MPDERSLKLPTEISIWRSKWHCDLCGSSWATSGPGDDSDIDTYVAFRAVEHVAEEHWPRTWYVTDEDASLMLGCLYGMYAHIFFP